MKTWRVTSSDAAEGLRKWRAGVSEAFVRLEPSSTRSSGFAGHIQQVTTPEMSVSVVRSDGHEVARLREHIRAAAPDVSFVNILRAGRSLVTQGAPHVASPMDVSIVDTRRAFSIRHDAPFELASIAVGSDLLPDGREATHLPLSRSAVGREMSFVLWGLAKTLLEIGPDKSETARATAAQFRSALALATEVTRDPVEPRATVDMLQSYILRNLALPRLSAMDLAQHFGLSVRRVHQLFEPLDRSVSAYVNDARLEAAAARLSDRSQDHHSIAQIAADVGYLDVSYFSRRFRRRFDCTPRGWRQNR